MSEIPILPNGWEYTTLGAIAHINLKPGVNGLSDDSLVSFVPMAAVEAGTGRMHASEVRHLRDVRRGYTAFRDGDIVFAKITPCMENGKTAIARDLESGLGFGSTEFHVIRPLADVETQFIYHLLTRESLRAAARAHMTGTAGQLRVPADFLIDLPIPLPPLAEQHRIVAAIEQQFTRLDVAVAALRRAQTALKRYRASVLKSAVEGRLTASWRAAHPGVEPASALLARILAERRARWETDLRAKGKDPAKARYDEPKAPDTTGLLELPARWCWATVDQLTDVAGGVTKGRDLTGRTTTTLPYLRVANVQRGYLDLDVIKTIAIPVEEVHRYLLHVGDVVLTEGGDADKLGRAALWQGQITACAHQNHIFRARMMDDGVLPPWLVVYLNSEQGQAYFRRAAKQTVNLASINLTQLRACPMPLPPLAEQHQIVAEVERRLSVVAEVEAEITANLARAARLRQSILREAFAGRLVPQDPADEPASMLLERIRRTQHGSDKSKLADYNGRKTGILPNARVSLATESLWDKP